MSDEVRIKIKIDSNSQELVLMKQQVQELGKSFTNADSFANTFMKRINLAGNIYAGYQLFNQTIADIARTGFETNRTMQNLTNSLTTLRAVSASNVDSMGNQLTIQQKYNMAQVEGKEALQELIKINGQTPHSLNETAKIYDAMYLGMKKVGASSEDMIDITKKISIAAGNRMNFDALLSAMDGLSTGTVETASDMGRFLKSIGLSNEAIKNSSNVIQLFKDKLSGFQAIDSFDTRISNLNNSFATLSGTLTKPFFDSFSKSMIPATELLNNLNIKLEDYYNNINKVQDIHKQNNVVTLKDELGELEKKLDSAKESSKRFYNEWTTHDEAEINKLELLIKTTKNKIKDLENPNKPKLVDAQTTRDDISIIKIMGTEYQKLNLDIDDNVKKLKEAGATQSEIDKFRATSIKDFNDKQSKANQKTFKEQEKNLETLSQAYSETAQIGMSDYNKSLTSIKDKLTAWTKAGVDNIEILRVQGILIDELYRKQGLETTKTDLSYYERKVQLQTESYEKELELQGISYGQKVLDIEGSSAEIAEKDKLIEKEAQLYDATVARMELDRNTEFQDTLLDFQNEALERQLELNQSVYDFGGNFEGIPGHIANASKAMQGMMGISLKTKKQEIDLNKKYEKAFTEFAGNVEQTKLLEMQYTRDAADLKTQTNEAEMAGYANLAGVIAGAYEQGSTAAIGFTTLQAALGIASSWTAIANAWALPFPANIPAVAMVATAVMPIIGQLSSIGGGGSSGGGSSGGGSSGGGSSGGGAKKPSQFEIREQQIEDLYTPMTDRIDRTNELLESIDKQGSSSAVGLAGAKISFEKDYALAVNEINKKLPNDVRGYGLDFNDQLAPIEAALGFNIADVRKIKKSGWDKSEKRIYTDFGSLNSGNNMIKLISAYFEDTSKNGAIAALFGGHNALNLAANEIQKTIGDFTSGIVDSLDDLKDASSDFKDHYDTITGSMYYENKKLADAFTDVKSLTNGKTFAEYLKQNIDEIDTLSNTFSDAVVNTLLSQDPKDMEKQIKVLEDLQAQTGLVFQGGAKDALDFLESIELVATAMSTSSSNIKNFLDGFKSEDLLALDLSNKLGTNLALNYDDLALKFKDMASDIYGLTDAELEFLDANKSYIERIQDAKQKALEDELELTKTSLSSIQSMSNSLDSVVLKLRGNLSTTTANSLQKFNESMASTMILSNGKDYKALEDSLKNTISYSEALNNADYFSSSRDMQFAQAIAANQFENMDLKLEDELSVLQQISENTSDMIEALENNKSFDIYAQNLESSVIPLKNLNDPLGQKELIAEIRALRKEVAELKNSSSKTAENTTPSRYVS